MPTHPTPPRFWWLKRLTPAVVLVAAAWAGFHLWLTRHVEAELAARAAAWRAENDGAPVVTGTGIPPATVNGEPNAADLLLRASAAVPPSTIAQSFWEYSPVHMPVPTALLPMAREIADQNAPALALARQATAAATVDWNRPSSNAFFYVSTFNSIQNLANQLCYALAVDHHDGRIGDALDRSLDVLRLARAMPDHAPSLISGLLAIGIDALASRDLRLLAWYAPPTLDKGAEAAAWRAARPRVAQVIVRLLDTDEDAYLLRRSLGGEREFAWSVINTPFAAAAVGMPPASAAARPLYASVLLRLVDDSTLAVAHPLDITVLSKLYRFTSRGGGGSAAAGFYDGIVFSFAAGIDHGVTSFGTVRAHRRATAVILAAKLFNADTGRWPASLDDLVPTYLPLVPDDPFLPPGTPMRLRTDAAVPLVYSAGADMADDGGSVRAPGSAAAFAGLGGPEQRQDLVFPLYLPPVAARFTLNFNVWYWLQDPEAAVAAAESEEATEVQRRTQELSESLPNDLGVENQKWGSDDEDDEQ